MLMDLDIMIINATGTSSDCFQHVDKSLTIVVIQETLCKQDSPPSIVPQTDPWKRTRVQKVASHKA